MLSEQRPAHNKRSENDLGGRPMTRILTRRSFALASAATLPAPAILRYARADEPLRLRLSLDTAPSHLRNVSLRDYLTKLEAAAGGKIKPEIFESGQLYPDLEV